MGEQRQKTILFNSNFCGSKTGFGRNAREVLTYLYKTGKYKIVEFASGLQWSAAEAKRVPWKCYGTWPDDQNEIAHILNHPASESLKRQVGYGAHNIDKIIGEVKPDVFIGVEDIWAFSGYSNKTWWKKITPIIHTTLDSLPILDEAVTMAKDTPNFYVWAKFAEEAMHELGQSHVKTIHGAIDTRKFHRINGVVRSELRIRNNIPLNSLIIGFVFRNQLRKSVHALIEGFKLFKKQNPSINAKLLLHTSWEERRSGWDIPKIVKDNDINPNDVLATYICRNCGEYEVKPFVGDDADCPHCKAIHNPAPKKPEERTGQCTPNITFGITEKQLNEVYNLMDVYVHPFTSGGQEIPIQEAKLTELVTLVTNYSCGTEYCTPESGGMPLEWLADREHQTNFIKARTYPASIAKQLSKFVKLNAATRQAMGRTAREFVIKTCGVEAVGSAFEKIIDEAPFTEWDFDMKIPKCNDKFPCPTVEDNGEFLKSLYNNILNVSPDETNFNAWMKDLKAGRPRFGTSDGVYEYFINEARRRNAQNHPMDLSKLIDSEEGRRKIAMVMPRSIGDCFLITALFDSLHETYPESDLYIITDPKYFEIFEGNSLVYKCLPYTPECDHELFLIGQGAHKGYFDIAFLPHLATQKLYNYIRHGRDKIAYNIRKENE